jgi:hypothetical protein
LVGFDLKSTLLRLRHGYVLSIGSIKAWCKAEDGAVAADDIGRTVTTTRHGGRVGVALDMGSLSQEMGCTWGRQSVLHERKRGSGPEGENWPKRFREKNSFLF